MDIDAAGGAATAGLVAGAIEKPTGKAGEAHSGHCTDCGAAVESRFCPECGQPTHVHRSLLHLVEEVLHGVLHFDARIWRTLPLLALNPGRLTREWVQGKRTRYVSPLALFLFTVFLIFFLFSFGGGGMEPVMKADGQTAAQLRAEIAELKQAKAQLPPETPRAGVAGMDVSIRAAEARLAQLEGEGAGPRADGLKPGSWQANMKDIAHENAVREGDKGAKGFQSKLLHKLENPDLALYKIKQTLYKFAFLLVPISIPFVALLFLWKRGPTWYDHGVFVLYSLTAMTILFAAMNWLGRIPWLGGWLVFAGLLAIPVHMFVQLKGAYGLSIFSATWRTIALMVFCNFTIALFAIAIVMLGLTG
ncbi:MAG: DUF3667 domain-containing protein [Pseudomonadota bacterium]